MNRNKINFAAKINIDHIYIIILIFISFFVIINNKFLFQSTISDIAHLGEEIFEKDGVLAAWELGNTAPFKYRVLFMWIVKGSHLLFFDYTDNIGFYYTFLFWSFIFNMSTGIALYYFLRLVKFEKIYAFVGGMMFYFSAPIFFAYIRPVHTREDFLAYLILLLGLIFIVKKKAMGVLFISIIGVFCRETLLVIPFIYLFFSQEAFSKRLIIASVPVVVYLLLRILIGYEPYATLELGLFYNIRNFAETLAFFYLVFGILWVPFFIEAFKKVTNNYNGLLVLQKSAPWVFLLVFLSTFIGGRISEIRLLFLLFPWIIPIALLYIKKNINYIRAIVSQTSYKIYAFSLLIALLLIHVYISDRYWVSSVLTNFILILSTIPFFYTALFKQKDQ